MGANIAHQGGGRTKLAGAAVFETCDVMGAQRGRVGDRAIQRVARPLAHFGTKLPAANVTIRGDFTVGQDRSNRNRFSIYANIDWRRRNRWHNIGLIRLWRGAQTVKHPTKEPCLLRGGDLFSNGGLICQISGDAQNGKCRGIGRRRLWGHIGNHHIGGCVINGRGIVSLSR